MNSAERLYKLKEKRAGVPLIKLYSEKLYTILDAEQLMGTWDRHIPTSRNSSKSNALGRRYAFCLGSRCVPVFLCSITMGLGITIVYLSMECVFSEVVSSYRFVIFFFLQVK